jgi:hypothetical protein
MRMTNESWEAAACSAIERKLFKIMMLNEWDTLRFVDEEAKEIWTSMYRNFCEGYPSFPEEKKQWLLEKFCEELPNISYDRKKWFLEKI